MKSTECCSNQGQAIIPADLYVCAHYVLSIEEAVDLGCAFEAQGCWLIGLRRLHLGPGVSQENFFQKRLKVAQKRFLPGIL
jgi:hypothetical protein